jgi:hypothetical protein
MVKEKVAAEEATISAFLVNRAVMVELTPDVPEETLVLRIKLQWDNFELALFILIFMKVVILPLQR